jgi:hypothetical protein
VRVLAAVIALLGLYVGLAPETHADIGGEVPGPGLCDYPGVGGSGMVMNVYYYSCDFPMEGNGSHWHCMYGGASVVGTAGVSILMFNANIAGNIGSLNGTCSWRCPDMTLAEAPNPPGAWKNHLNAVKCKTVGPNPDLPPADDSQQPPPPVPIGDQQHPQPAVTNPGNPNPLATQNPDERK